MQTVHSMRGSDPRPYKCPGAHCINVCTTYVRTFNVQLLSYATIVYTMGRSMWLKD